ncbi:hypothetical protein ACH47C_05945 [Streptomyces rishiriensis]|uniref:hypothetical protein n=1 Tax=Streptomyces rishiriensis TaxID=68264 RepID=UPI003408656F
MDQQTATKLVTLLDAIEEEAWKFFSESAEAHTLWEAVKEVRVLVSGQVKGRECGNPECSTTVVTSTKGRPAMYCGDKCRYRAAYLRTH